jgi:hypothetical protein
MYLESLLRLAEITDHYKQKDQFVVDPEFHTQTEELIKSQSEILTSELEFRKNNPGPYNFGFGDLVITIFSPEETGQQEWAMLARRGDWHKAYRFNSVMGVVKALVSVIQETEAASS